MLALGVSLERAVLAAVLMCSLAAAVENAKEVLTTPGGWLSVGQGFSLRELALALVGGSGGGEGACRGVGGWGGGSMGSQRLFACFPSRALISFIPFVAEGLLGQFPLRGI